MDLFAVEKVYAVWPNRGSRLTSTAYKAGLVALICFLCLLVVCIIGEFLYFSRHFLETEDLSCDRRSGGIYTGGWPMHDRDAQFCHNNRSVRGPRRKRTPHRFIPRAVGAPFQAHSPSSGGGGQEPHVRIQYQFCELKLI